MIADPDNLPPIPISKTGRCLCFPDRAFGAGGEILAGERGLAGAGVRARDRGERELTLVPVAAARPSVSSPFFASSSRALASSSA